MNKSKSKVFARRVELASNVIAGSALSGSVALMYRDNAIDLTYWVVAVGMSIFAMLLYMGVTVFLMELADAESADTNSDSNDSG
jgi:hypothetical protein